MNKKFLIISFLTIALMVSCNDRKSADHTDLGYIMTVVRSNPEPVVDKDHPGSRDNDRGYENGHVIKVDGVYHMLMTELFDNRYYPDLYAWLPARLGYWKSADGDHWERVCTIAQGTASGRSDDLNDPYCATWSSSWYWNEEENRWNIIWRGCRWYWRYQSVIEGPEGFAGPYSEVSKLLPPLMDMQTQQWDDANVASFGNIYIAEDGKYYSFLSGGYPTTARDPQWVNTLGCADSIDGPWTRVYDPDAHPTFMYSENPFVNIYEINGKKVYFCVYDDLSSQHSLGYGYSLDGIHWTGNTLDLTGYTDWAMNEFWVESIRTPCCLIREDDGTYTIIFTACGKDGYFSIARINVAITEVKKPSGEHVVFPGDIQNWKALNGNFEVQYGREYSCFDGGNSVFTAATYTDVTVEASLRCVNQERIFDPTANWDPMAKAGVYVRKTSVEDKPGEGKSGYYAYLTANETVQLYAGDQLLSEVTVGKRPAIFRKLKMSVKGNRIRVYYGGDTKPCIDVKDNTYKGKGYVGIDVYQSHWHYERIEIY